MINQKNWFFLFCSVLIIFGGRSNALAQSPHVSGIQIDWSLWNFKPMYEEVSGALRVTGFLALAKEYAVTGDNIVAVWYIRGSNGTWGKKSWLTTDPNEVVESVKLQTGIPDAEDELWEIGQEHYVPSGNAPEDAKPYGQGVLEADPLYLAIQSSEDPALYIAMLTMMGYKSADIKIDNPPASVDGRLEAMAIAVEVGLLYEVTSEAGARAQTEAIVEIMYNLGVLYTPPPTCDAKVIGPWVLGAVSPAYACAWNVSSSWTAVPSGRAYTCEYVWCCAFSRTRSALAQRTDCSTYTCT